MDGAHCSLGFNPESTLSILKARQRLFRAVEDYSTSHDVRKKSKGLGSSVGDVQTTDFPARTGMCDRTRELIASSCIQKRLGWFEWVRLSSNEVPLMKYCNQSAG